MKINEEKQAFSIDDFRLLSASTIAMLTLECKTIWFFHLGSFGLRSHLLRENFFYLARQYNSIEATIRSSSFFSSPFFAVFNFNNRRAAGVDWWMIIVVFICFLSFFRAVFSSTLIRSDYFIAHSYFSTRKFTRVCTYR